MPHKIKSHRANSRVQGFHWTTSVKRRPTLEKEIKFRKNIYYAMSIGTKAHAKTSTTPDRIKICQDNPGRADTVSSLPYYQDKFHHQVHLVPECGFHYSVLAISPRNGVQVMSVKKTTSGYNCPFEQSELLKICSEIANTCRALF
jgi:hypothetical protein